MAATPQEQAAQRAAARQASREADARQRRRLRLAIAVAVGAGTVVLTASLSNPGGSSDAAETTLLTEPPPWPPQARGLAERVSALGFPPTGDESYHAHALLTVYRNGDQVPVPANIGFDERGAHTSLHTHTPDGVIHMEADDPYPYEVGHLFTTWGVAFDDDRLASDVAEGDKQVHVYVNGERAPEGPVVIEDGDNIVVAYGTEGSFPKLPSADAIEQQ